MKILSRQILVATCLLGLFNVQVTSSAVVQGIDHSGSANGVYVHCAKGVIRHVKEGDTYTTTESCKVFFKVESSGWANFPLEPKRQVLIVLHKGVRRESLMATALIFSKRKIMLQSPPVSSPWHLPAGLAQLAGLLERDGHKVTQRYGYISGLEHLLVGYGGDEARKALRTIRDPKSNIHEWHEARMTFERISREIPAGRTRFVVERNNVTYVDAFYDGTISYLAEGLHHREESLWYRYFVEVEVPLAQEFRPEIYGISLNDERQIAPGLVLASLIKEALPGSLIVIGGNVWPRLTHVFGASEFGQIFDHCDAIVYREGYEPLRRLAANLELAGMPGTVWRRKGSIVMNPSIATPFDFRDLPTPVFDRTTEQWSPDFVPSLYTASECPMACGYCAISAGSDTFLSGSPRRMTPRQVAEHVQAIGASRFDIFDETFVVKCQLELGRELRAIGHEATWQCYLTITNQLLDPGLCSRLYEAGCRAVQLGLETLSRETLCQEHKSWNTPTNYARILENLRKAGIQVHVFIIIGIPGQPLHWDLKWIPFLEDNASSITTIKVGRYRLTRMSPEEKGGTHSALIKVLPDEHPLHLNRDFEYRSPEISNKRLDAVRSLLEQACRRHPLYQVTSTVPWWVNRGRKTWPELEEQAKALQMSDEITTEPEVPHLKRALTKAETIVRVELGKEVAFETFESLANFARTL